MYKLALSLQGGREQHIVFVLEPVKQRGKGVNLQNTEIYLTPESQTQHH